MQTSGVYNLTQVQEFKDIISYLKSKNMHADNTTTITNTITNAIAKKLVITSNDDNYKVCDMTRMDYL